MNGLLLASSPESKDIKFNSKKIADTEDELLASESKFFQNLMEELLHEMPDSKNKDFLIAKILDLPEDFAKKEEIRSSFSNEKLFTDHQIDKVSIESMIEIASFLKTHPQEQAVMHFPTDSKALQTSLLDLNVQQEFKNARTISDLLKIAEKNGIEVKNFTFFKEEAALDTQSKEMVKKINSEEIFKLMEGQSAKQSKAVLQNNLIPSETQKEPDVLKHMLSGAERKTQAKESAFTPGKLPADHKSNTAAAVENISPEEPQKVKHTDKTDHKNTVSTQTLISQHAETKELQTDKNIPSRMQTQQTNREDAERNSGKISIATEPKVAKAVTEQTLSRHHEDKTTRTKTPDTQMKVDQNNFNERSTAQTKIIATDKTAGQHTAVNTPDKDDTASPAPLKKAAEPVHTKTVSREIPVQEQVKTPDTQMGVHKNNVSKKHTDKAQMTSVDKTVQQHIAANTPVKNENPVKTTEVKTKRETDVKIVNPLFSENAKNISQPNMKQESVSIQKQPAEDRNFSEMLKSESGKNISETEQSDTNHVEKTIVSHETKTQQLQQNKIQQHTDFKKTFNSFAREFKEQVESYKAPLMKIKMQLNPGNLGDVDVTLISRGNNLQVNINSNPATIAIFAQNQTEFKNALINMGFSGLQMNFGENKDSGRGQQHRESNRQTRYTEEELQEKDGFEMIVPRYV